MHYLPEALVFRAESTAPSLALTTHPVHISYAYNIVTGCLLDAPFGVVLCGGPLHELVDLNALDVLDALAFRFAEVFVPATSPGFTDQIDFKMWRDDVIPEKLVAGRFCCEKRPSFGSDLEVFLLENWSSVAFCIA